MITRRDFDAMASKLGSLYKSEFNNAATLNVAVEAVADVFADSNSNFNRSRFLEAVDKAAGR